jgi:hypothetical protein
VLGLVACVLVFGAGYFVGSHGVQTESLNAVSVRTGDTPNVSTPAVASSQLLPGLTTQPFTKSDVLKDMTDMSTAIWKLGQPPEGKAGSETTGAE